jgi:hypothetical protein
MRFIYTINTISNNVNTINTLSTFILELLAEEDEVCQHYKYSVHVYTGASGRGR